MRGLCPGTTRTRPGTPRGPAIAIQSGRFEDLVTTAWPDAEQLPFADSSEFFEQGDEAAAPWSDSLDASDEASASFSLEERERRRARFVRVVAAIMGALSVITVVAMVVHSRREVPGPIPAPLVVPGVPVASEPVVLDIPMIIEEPAVPVAAPSSAASARSEEPPPTKRPQPKARVAPVRAPVARSSAPASARFQD